MCCMEKHLCKNINNCCMKDIVSVVVPIYKVEAYLCRCIDSLLTQTYPHLEIILVDDGSPDNCGKICDEYRERDSRIKVLHQTNGGLSAARNSGIEMATGKWLMFVDSDDYVTTDFCEHALYKAHSTESDIVVFGYEEVYSDHTVLQDIPLNEEGRLTREEALLELHGGRILSLAWNKLYRSSLFKDTGIRYPVGRLLEDIGTTYLLFDQANAVYLSSGVFYYYQKRADSIMGRKIGPKEAVDWFDMLVQRFIYMEQHYPEISRKTWLHVGNSMLFCLKNLYVYRGCVEEKERLCDFIRKHKKQWQTAGIKDLDLLILYCSPFLFSCIRRLKKLFRKCEFFFIRLRG